MALITENQLKADIKSGSFSNVYLFYGRDVFSAEGHVKAMLKKLLDKDSRDMNLHQFEGKNLDMAALSDACESLPFFAEHTVCTVSNVNAFNKQEMTKDKYDRLISIIKDIPDTSVLIFYFNAIDVCKGKKKPDQAYKRLIDNVTKYGSVCFFPQRTDNENAKIIESLARKKGAAVGRGEALTLARRCAGDMLLINSELDKLAAYAKGAPVTEEMIDLLCAGELDSQIYHLTDAVVFGKRQDALRLYKELTEMRQEPIVLLYSLMNTFIDLYRAKAALDCGRSAADVKSDFSYGARGFTVDNAFKSVGRVSSERITRCVELLAECERAFKSRSAKLQGIALEETIIKMVSY